MQSSCNLLRGITMAEKPVLLTRAAIAQIQQVVREYNNRNYKNLNNPLPRGRWEGRYPITSHRPAVIGSALISPTSSLVAATSCTVYFLELQSGGTQALNVTPYTAYNDDPELSASVGTYCRLELLNGRWMIYYLSCNTQAALIAVLP